jgi:ribonuclease HI
MSSNRPELGGVVLALQSAALSEDALLLCDNEAVLRVIRKWVGQGGKATLATAPDADILGEIIHLLAQRVRAGRATFLVKVKSHRGEPINERADTLAEEGRALLDEEKRWDDRTDRMTFEVRKGNTTVRSVWTNSVRNAFRKQAGWAKLQEARAAAAKHWTERVWYCHNQRWLQASRAGTEESQREVSKMKRTGARNALKI